MGFRPDPTIYNLSFDGTFLDGLHVRMSCCTLAEHNEMSRASLDAVMTSVDPGDESEQDVNKLREIITGRYRDNNRILELFANHLVSWDLEDVAGRAVPTTREGIDSQEKNIISALIGAWQTAMVSVPNLSKPDSNDGKISEEQSLGLGSASQNLGS